jgi:hypothetical protein
MAERKTETRCAPVEAIAAGPGRGVSQPQVGPKPACGKCRIRLPSGSAMLLMI